MKQKVFLLLCFVDPVWHCDYLIGEEAASCFASFWFVICVCCLSVCLVFLLVSLVGYVV